ncbi:rabenosyn-5 [Bombina bombina]|uniref:rabenosyn-5 n=1 Tax=Bombina bombina TaxID=8345 RepID=UPI00235A7A4A|nr:rabenosyn-5 [Bombina bombina]
MTSGRKRGSPGPEQSIQAQVVGPCPHAAPVGGISSPRAIAGPSASPQPAAGIQKTSENPRICKKTVLDHFTQSSKEQPGESNEGQSDSESLGEGSQPDHMSSARPQHFITEATLKKLLANQTYSITKEIQRNHAELRKEMSEIGDRVDSLERKQDDIATDQTNLLTYSESLAEQINQLEFKLADVEDRARRNNVRFRGIPEDIQPAELQNFLKDLFKDLLGPTEGLIDTMERAHRALRPRTVSQEKPRDVIVCLVQIAKKAKNKLLKRDGAERVDGGSQERYEAFSYGGIDPCMWDPQEIGAMKSHLLDFKKHRAARIDHYVVEVNKLIIRLEKLTSFDRGNMDAAKIRALEKSLVSWVNDQDVPFCPDCGNKFSIRNRRHHCRLCGSIMCKPCTELITLPLAYKLTSASKHSLSAHDSPNLSPNTSTQTSRRGSISSLSSVSSVLDEKDDDKIRCCLHCKETLLKREMQMDEKQHTPEIVKLYQKLRACMEKVDQKAPEYIRMAQSINAGETTYNLDDANNLRIEVQKYYELIDALSKKILILGLNEEPKPHPKSQQLQKRVRHSATLFVQEKLLGLMSLPTREKYEELKEKRKLENEQRMQREQVALETKRRGRESMPQFSPTPNGEISLHGQIRKVEGWLPTSGVSRNREASDPLLQQIDNITSYIQQARMAGRVDEVQMLEENLRQLQEEYDQQQVDTAIRISKELAEEEAMQREQLEVLRWREVKKELAQQNRTPPYFTQLTSALKTDKDPSTVDTEFSSGHVKLVPPLSRETENKSERENHPFISNNYMLHDSQVYCQSEKVKAESSNPFEDEDDRPEFADPPHSQQNGGRDYNPFEDDNVQTEEVTISTNPFESSTDNYWEPAVSKNPFEVEEDEVAVKGIPFNESWEATQDEVIEEDLLLQQIDNIKAYIFDAKHSGRLDEVELLTDNLRELKQKLAKQKGLDK